MAVVDLNERITLTHKIRVEENEREGDTEISMINKIHTAH